MKFGSRAENVTEIVSMLNELGDEEILCGVFILRRLLMGQSTYGKLALAKADRDWDREVGEEGADIIAYGAMRAVQAWVKRVERSERITEVPPPLSVAVEGSARVLDVLENAKAQVPRRNAAPIQFRLSDADTDELEDPGPNEAA